MWLGANQEVAIGPFASFQQVFTARFDLMAGCLPVDRRVVHFPSLNCVFLLFVFLNLIFLSVFFCILDNPFSLFLNRTILGKQNLVYMYVLSSLAKIK